MARYTQRCEKTTKVGWSQNFALRPDPRRGGQKYRPLKIINFQVAQYNPFYNTFIIWYLKKNTNWDGFYDSVTRQPHGHIIWGLYPRFFCFFMQKRPLHLKTISLTWLWEHFRMLLWNQHFHLFRRPLSRSIAISLRKEKKIKMNTWRSLLNIRILWKSTLWNNWLNGSLASPWTPSGSSFQPGLTKSTRIFWKWLTVSPISALSRNWW